MSAAHNVFPRTSTCFQPLMARAPLKEADQKVRADNILAEVQLIQGSKDDAIATYRRTLMFADINNPKNRPYVEQAFEKGTPVMVAAERWKDVLDSCLIYLDGFPAGRTVKQARLWRDLAKAKLGAAGLPEPEAPSGSAAPEAAAEKK